MGTCKGGNLGTGNLGWEKKPMSLLKNSLVQSTASVSWGNHSWLHSPCVIFLDLGSLCPIDHPQEVTFAPAWGMTATVDKSSNSGGLEFRWLLSVASLELVRLFQGSHRVVWAGSRCEENLWVWLSQAVSPCHSISPPPPLPSVDSKSKQCQGRHSSTLLTFLALQCIAVEKQVTEVPGIHALLHWSSSSK